MGARFLVPRNGIDLRPRSSLAAASSKAEKKSPNYDNSEWKKVFSEALPLTKFLTPANQFGKISAGCCVANESSRRKFEKVGRCLRN
jgi:hypothetical protein